MRTRLLLALVALVLPLALVGPAGAAPSTGGTGTFTVTGKPQMVSSHTTHGYTVLVETLPGIVYSGVVACPSVTEYASFMTDPHGAGNWIALDVSDSCTVAGRTGPLADQAVGTLDAHGNYFGHFVLSGSGGLATFHGEGVFWGNLSSPTGYFGIQYRFE